MYELTSRIYLPPGGLVTFPLTPAAGVSRSLLEALAVVEAHFRETKITSHTQTLRMRETSTTFFVGVDKIVPHRDSSTDIAIVGYF
jgi:hypothetical protein